MQAPWNANLLLRLRSFRDSAVLDLGEVAVEVATVTPTPLMASVELVVNIRTDFNDNVG